MLGRFRMPVHDCLVEYSKIANTTFAHPRLISQRNLGLTSRPKYSAKAMEMAIKNMSARRCELSETTLGNHGENLVFASDLRSRHAICKT